MNTQLLWGIDLGGTKTEGIVLKPGDNPQIISRLRIPTEKERGYEHIIHQIKQLIQLLKKDTWKSPTNIGVGIPGTLEPDTKTVKNANTTILNHQPLKKDLESKLQLPVRVENDANCFALAETQFGAVRENAPKAKVVFGVILGTGVGGGIVVNGEIITGKQGIAGEWGHNYLDESGGKCYCGKTGCVETVISGPALEKFYTTKTSIYLPLQQINERHRKGIDDAASETINRLNFFFGKGIAQVVNILDPDAVVLGGGVSNVKSLYNEGLKAAESFVFNHTLETKFIAPQLGDSAGVIGAAYLWA
jgi:predicted NBD/HSP70 family sugar kinase